MKINEAKDLDHVIAAHETFLNQVMTRALMDQESRVCMFYVTCVPYFFPNWHFFPSIVHFPDWISRDLTGLIP